MIMQCVLVTADGRTVIIIFNNSPNPIRPS